MNQESTKHRVFIVEDHQVVLQGLQMIIASQTDMTVVGTATNGQEAIQMLERIQPDVIVFDISMPIMNGIRMTENLIAMGIKSHLLALTANEDRAYVSQLLRDGISGFLLKRSAAEDLVKAIRCVAKGERFIDPAIPARLISQDPKISDSASSGHGLSEREEQVLMLLAKGFTNKEVAVKLNISVKTIETHKSRAMLKCGLRSRAEIVRYALSRGWLETE